MKEVEVQYNARTRRLNRTVKHGGLVMGFTWQELIKKFNACGVGAIDRITVNDFGLSIYHEGDDPSVGFGRKTTERFMNTPPDKKPVKK